MNVPRTKSWGLKIPRPPTPSEGAAQVTPLCRLVRTQAQAANCSLSYRDTLASARQRAKSNWSIGMAHVLPLDLMCVTLDKTVVGIFIDLTVNQDLVDEFEMEHPFLEQIALMDSTIADLIPLHNSYQNIEYADKDPNQAAWDNFRSMNLNPVTTTVRTYKLESGIYSQVPSRYASRHDVVSVYSTNLVQVGYGDNDLSDARFASLSQKDLEIKKVAQKARLENRGWREKIAKKRLTSKDLDREQGTETEVAGHGQGSGRGRYQELNLAVLLNQRGSSIASYGSHEPRVAEQQTSMPTRQNTTQQSWSSHPHGNRHSNNGKHRSNRYSARGSRKEQTTNQDIYGKNATRLEQQAMFAGTFTQPYGHMMPAAARPSQPVGYMVPLPFIGQHSQFPGYMVPLTAETRQQFRHGFGMNQSSDGITTQYIPLGMQGNLQEQIPRGPPATHSSEHKHIARDSAATHKSGDLGNVNARRPMQPVHASFVPDNTRRSVAAYEPDYRNPQSTYLASQIHLSGPQPIDASRRLQLHALDPDDYVELDREFDFWLDEENPMSSRYRGDRHSLGSRSIQPSPQLGPELNGVLRRMDEVDTNHEYASLIRRRAAANSLTVPQRIQGHRPNSSQEYLGYTIFGQRPGEISREPSPAFVAHASRRPRLYESRRSTPGLQHSASFESRRSSPGPQGSAKYNNPFAYNGVL